MVVKLNELVEEAERLLELSADIREQEGIYASNDQLRFLIKKLNSARNDPSKLSGVEKFVSDLASSNSKILQLLDAYQDYGRGKESQ